MNTDVSPASLKLIDGATEITIRPAQASAGDPIMCKEWNLGSPEIRVTSTPNPGADGVSMGPGFLGQRTITLDLIILGGTSADDGLVHTPYWYVDQLIAMTHPRRQPILEITRLGRAWQIGLRGDPYSIAYGRRAAAMLELQLSFVAPTGLIAGPLQSVSASANAAATEQTEWVFPAAFPKTFGAGNDLYPTLTITIGGASPVAPTIYISGPVTNPEIRTDAGERFKFSGLVLVTGQTVEIDMAARTIRMGDAATGAVSDDLSLYASVDWAVSTFWTWQPGVHIVRYIATEGAITVQYRESQLTV